MATSEHAIARRSATSASGAAAGRNVGEVERWASIVGGGTLALYGLTRGTLAGAALAALGGTLVYRGATAHCPLYAALNLNSAESGAGHVGQVGIKVEKQITINRPAEELYAFWRNFENLPRVMSHVRSVNVIEPSRSHWIVDGPAGTTVEWDAVVHNDVPNEIIAWRSAEGADVRSAGAVVFRSTPGGGTELKVSLQYDPPGGVLGSLVARLFGEAPDQQIEEDLQRFKRAMESGESSGRAAQPGK